MELSMELSAEFIRPMEERNSVPGIGAAENKNVFGEKEIPFSEHIGKRRGTGAHYPGRRGE